jgi:RNA-directed DNA polymerase
MEVAGPLVPATLAVGPRHGAGPGQDQGATSRRFVGHPIAWVVGNLNRVLRGWGAYFRYGNSARKFAQIDGYVHERLVIFASIKHGRHGRNYHRFTWGWFTSLGVYLLSGRVRSGAAHAFR